MNREQRSGKAASARARDGAAQHQAVAAAVALDAAVAGALGAGIDAENSHASEASISFSSMSKFDHTCWTSSWSSSASISLTICCARLAFELDVVLRHHRDLRGGRLDAQALHRVAHRLERVRRAEHLPVVAIVAACRRRRLRATALSSFSSSAFVLSTTM